MCFHESVCIDNRNTKAIITPFRDHRMEDSLVSVESGSPAEAGDEVISESGSSSSDEDDEIEQNMVFDRPYATKTLQNTLSKAKIAAIS